MSCDTPLTAYSGMTTGEVSQETRVKAARLSLRPPIINVVAALDALFALFGPFAVVMGRFMARTVTNAEGTNYAGAAFGAVGIAFTAMVMLPFGGFLLYIAWLTWARGSWAWQANAIVLCGAALLALVGFLTPSFSLRLLVVAACAAAAWFWFQPDVREWYGA